MTKLYANKKGFLVLDARLLELYEFLCKHKDKKEDPSYKRLVKRVHDNVRKSMELEKNIISMLIHDDRSQLIIMSFDVIATEDNFYKLQQDEEGYYIELEA